MCWWASSSDVGYSHYKPNCYWRNSFPYGLRSRSYDSGVKVGLSLSHCLYFNNISNEELRRYKLDILEERRDESQIKFTSCKWKIRPTIIVINEEEIISHRRSCVKEGFFSSKKLGAGTLGPNWESSYHIKKELWPGTYKIVDMDGNAQPHSWNIEHGTNI